MMNRRFIFAFLAWLAMVPFSVPTAAAAETVQAAQAATSAAQVSSPALQPCPADKLKLSETVQADCCKGHKGVCGCRAGKIVCCDGTASPNCTCHGDGGFVE
jgi:hypothetical protein